MNTARWRSVRTNYRYNIGSHYYYLLLRLLQEKKKVLTFFPCFSLLLLMFRLLSHFCFSFSYHSLFPSFSMSIYSYYFLFLFSYSPSPSSTPLLSFLPSYPPQTASAHNTRSSSARAFSADSLRGRVHLFARGQLLFHFPYVLLRLPSRYTGQHPH